ncbi:uncharacterized protein [Argopecten irradians]|uniref:uncharacterized protein n=1 Tax=Argopecten irradians TaxID=31199 RepID=UPI00371DB0FB
MEWYPLLPFVTIFLFVYTTEGRSPPMCEHDGKYYTDGETVTDGCVTAMCYRGRKWRPTKAGCLFNGKCLRNRQTVNAEECQSVQCIANKRMTRTKLVYKTDCPWKGECMKNRRTWMEGCIEYKCRVKKNKAKVEIAKKGCEYAGKCYKNEEHFSDDSGSCYCSNGELMCVGVPVTHVHTTRGGRSTRPPITMQ